MADEPKPEAPASKPGFKTPEFWLTAFAALVSALLSSGLFMPDSKVMQILGVAGMVLTVLGYTVARTGMKKTLVLLICVGMLAIAGCCRGHISADAVDGLITDVTVRHDKLVTQAPDIKPEDKATYLRSSELLRKTVKTARE